MDVRELENTALRLVAPGKGILAADESTTTIGKRFQKIGVENSEETRRAYRDMLFTAEGCERYVSGVILYDETLRQNVGGGVPVPEYLAKRGIVPGIKVDKGSKPLALSSGEEVTEGLDGLRDRLVEYRTLGARFAKWRAVVNIGDAIPTRGGIEANAHALARYAALCQETGLVPIVEPEVLMDGAHSLARCYEVTDAVQRELFDQLHRQRVAFSGILLKPNMVVPGERSDEKTSAEEVAEWTLRTLRRNVPSSVPGVVFLSGGLPDELATACLDATNRAGAHPWKLSFSYGRALQQAALKTWAGKETNRRAAQKAFLKRARLNGAATEGKYVTAMERDE